MLVGSRSTGASDKDVLGARGRDATAPGSARAAPHAPSSASQPAPPVRSRDNVTGATPLHLAAGQNAARLRRLLLAHGAHIDALDRRGFAPLQAALAADSAAAEQVLRDAGAIEPKLRFLDRAGLAACARASPRSSSSPRTPRLRPACSCARCELEEMWRDVAEGGDVSAWRSVCLEALRYRDEVGARTSSAARWAGRRCAPMAMRFDCGTARHS